jgi:hypothetical protein
MTTPYHAEASFVMAGRCFRMISGGAGEAGPTHCPDIRSGGAGSRRRMGAGTPSTPATVTPGRYDPQPIQPHPDHG